MESCRRRKFRSSRELSNRRYVLAERAVCVMRPKLAFLLLCGACWKLAVTIRSGIYVDNGVDQTLVERNFDREESGAIQNEILHLMGLHHEPRVVNQLGNNESAPKFLLDVYKSLVENENLGEMKDTSFVPFTSKFITQAGASAIDDSDIIMTFKSHSVDGNVWFDVSELSRRSLLQAELRVFKHRKTSEGEPDCDVTVSIFQVTRAGTDPSDGLRLLSEADSRLSFEGWLLANVTSAVLRWMESPSDNLGLRVTARLDGREADVSAAGLSPGKERLEDRPFLVAYISSPDEGVSTAGRLSRPSRSAKKFGQRYAGSSKGRRNPYSGEHRRGHGCQRKTLFISFKDLGWQEWVIAPDGFAAFYCDGVCSFPLNAHMNATNHAIVQTLVHIMNPHLIPKARCAPKALSPISVLYYDDDNNVILKKFPNMMIKSCGCH